MWELILNTFSDSILYLVVHSMVFTDFFPMFHGKVYFRSLLRQASSILEIGDKFSLSEPENLSYFIHIEGCKLLRINV